MSQGQWQTPLQKPPGYRDPINTTTPQPPPQRKAAALPPSFYWEERRNWCKICCCCTCFILFTLIVILFIIGAIFYVWFDPKLPIVQLKTIKFTKFHVMDTDAGPVLDAKSNIDVEIKNPNKRLELIYDKTHVVLKAGDDASLGEQTLPGFTQETNHETTLKFTITASNILFLGKKDAAMVKVGYKKKNLVVSTEVKTGIGLKWNGWKSETVQVSVICDGITLKQIENGATPKCHVKLLDRIYVD